MSKTQKKQEVDLNIEELKGFLTHIVTNNRFLQNKGITPVTVNIEGDAGLGKTSAVLQLSKELGVSFVRLNLATIEELGDLVGFPIRQFQLCIKSTHPVAADVTPEVKMVKRQVMEDGKPVVKLVPETIVKKETEPATPSDVCLWVDEHAVEDYVKRGYSFTGEKRMSYCPPEWIAGLPEGGGILLLDDYTRADMRFLQACMTLIETQKYISWELPKDWHIFLTTNPDNGDYLVTSMDSAQKTRFISVNLKFDVQVWAKWAEGMGIDSRCINFLMMHPEVVKGDVNPRAITTFFNSISSLPDFEKELGLIKMVGDGSVGPEFSSMFALFINNKLDKLISPRDILFGASTDNVLGELKKCIGEGKGYRADIASILTTRVINFGLHYAENNSVDDKLIDRLIALTTVPDIITDDLRYLMAKKLVGTNKAKFQKLTMNKQVAEMVMR